MIGKIKGTLVEVEANVGLVETASGLSYNVYLTNSLLTSYQPPAEVEIVTYLQVREDAMVLFGFKTKQEHKLFHLLLDVPGVGPKSAFTVVSFSKADELIAAVKVNDVKYFTGIPGLGKKTALKIILELSQKFKTEFRFEEAEVSEDDKTVIEALTTLGFKVSEARSALEEIQPDLAIEEKVKKAIQILTKNK